MNLRWKITNTSKNYSWPSKPAVKNFSNESFSDEDKINNPILTQPFDVEKILGPDESWIFELKFKVPEMNEKMSCNLNFFLTNPLKNFEKFGDGMIAIIEILSNLIVLPDL